MRKLIYIILLTLVFQNCTPEKESSKKTFEFLYSLLMFDLYNETNICPPVDATLEPGIHTITLDEGEEYWFNVSENAEKYSPSYYKIGIIEKSGQTLSVGNPVCFRNGQIFEPTTVKAEGTEPSYFENGFNIYVLFFDVGLPGIKSQSGSGEIKIKVP